MRRDCTWGVANQNDRRRMHTSQSAYLMTPLAVTIEYEDFLSTNFLSHLNMVARVALSSVQLPVQ
jgi:hypothetical protein